VLGLFFDAEDGGDMFLRNVGWFSTDYTAYLGIQICSVCPTVLRVRVQSCQYLNNERDFITRFVHSPFSLELCACHPGAFSVSWLPSVLQEVGRLPLQSDTSGNDKYSLGLAHTCNF
jgi:hypothetical protein